MPLKSVREKVAVDCRSGVSPDNEPASAIARELIEKGHMQGVSLPAEITIRRSVESDDWAAIKATAERKSSKSKDTAPRIRPDDEEAVRLVDEVAALEAQFDDLKASLDSKKSRLAEYGEQHVTALRRKNKSVIRAVVLCGDSGKIRCTVKNQYTAIKDQTDDRGNVLRPLDDIIAEIREVIGRSGVPDEFSDLFKLERDISISTNGKENAEFRRALIELSERFPGSLEIVEALKPTAIYHERRMTSEEFWPIHHTLSVERQLLKPYAVTIMPVKK